MKPRIWYPQLDIYDTIRRISLLLYSWESPYPILERLYIADFFLANPPLIHKTTMPNDIRTAFRSLSIPRPEKTFLSYPAAPLLFHKMEPIQKKAFQALAGRGIVDPEKARHGIAELSTKGNKFVKTEYHESLSSAEYDTALFLASQFAIIGKEGVSELRRRTGLRRFV